MQSIRNIFSSESKSFFFLFPQRKGKKIMLERFNKDDIILRYWNKLFISMVLENKY